MAAAERARLLEAWNDTAIAYDDRCMHTLIEAQAARTPDATAVVFEAETLTYAELDARANRVAQVLRTMGVGPDTLVGLHMPRSLEMIVGALAIHKAGGAYVPLDSGYPAERIAHYLADSAAPVVLTRSDVGAPPAGARRGAAPHRRRPADRGGAGGAGGLGRRPGEPRLRDLHLGLDRQAQGRDDRAPQRRQLLRRHGRAHRRGGAPASGWRSRASPSTSRCSSCSGPSRAASPSSSPATRAARSSRAASSRSATGRSTSASSTGATTTAPARASTSCCSKARSSPTRTASPRSGPPSATSTPSAAPTRIPR